MRLPGLADLRSFLRSTSLSTLRLVQIRVEIRVVVHLELVVGLMTLAARENIVEQFLQTVSKVLLLMLADRELLGDGCNMFRSRIITFGLFLQVVDA